VVIHSQKITNIDQFMYTQSQICQIKYTYTSITSWLIDVGVITSHNTQELSLMLLMLNWALWTWVY